MTYALFIDDERAPPADGRAWIIARTSAEALAIVHRAGWPDYVSFDHDLGGDDTAMVFVKAVIEILLDHAKPLPFAWTVHSQNPIGAESITGLLAAYQRHHPKDASGCSLAEGRDSDASRCPHLIAPERQPNGPSDGGEQSIN